MNQLNTITVGGSGVAVSEIASQIEVPSSGDTSEIIKVIIQLVIGVATLLGLFKKKTPKS